MIKPAVKFCILTTGIPLGHMCEKTSVGAYNSKGFFMGLMMKELVHDQIQLRNTEAHKWVDGRTKCTL